MDGPYQVPPTEEFRILALLKQVNVDYISLKSIKILPRELFGRFGSQTVKTSWRKSHDVTVDISLKTTSTDDVKERIRLLQEAAILAQFRHPNVVRLHGIINKDNVVMLISEHFHKEDLSKFLLQMGRSIIPPDTPKLLLHFSQQVALGMQYLASKGFIHRDLAARNVFVTSNDICKVGELWKSKELSDIGDGDMLDKIFVKWTAPEAMYHHKYSTASDIWSYGCLLYEIWSLGRIPFKKFTNKEVIEKLDSGYRLPPPPGCPKSIYQLMIQCWNPRPVARPTFKEILHVLLKDENETLQIPVKDACTHDASIVLGAELDASKYMYTELQHTYVPLNSTGASPTGSGSQNGRRESKGKRSDYDHIYGTNFFTSFPTSSADIECMYKGQDVSAAGSTNSVVPQPKLFTLRTTSPTARSMDLELAAIPRHQQLMHETLDSDYEEIQDAR